MKLKEPTIQYSNSQVLCGTGIFKQNNFKLELTFAKLIEDGHFNQDWELKMTDGNVPSQIKLRIKVE